MPAPKFPLAVRKNIRDDFEQRKEELGKKFEEMFGQAYTFDVDFLTLFQQADEGYQQERIGKCVFEAYEAMYESLKHLTDDGENQIAIEHFNTVVSKHSITVIMDENCPGDYCACRIEDGVFQIVFKPRCLSINIYRACENIGKTIDEAMTKNDPKGLPLSAKMNLQKEWLDKKSDLEANIAKELNEGPADQCQGEKLTCHANYDEMWARIVEGHDALSKSRKGDIDLESAARNFGGFLLSYFESLRSKMQYDFKADEMIVEAFLDEVNTKEAWFEIVHESELKSAYNDTVIENGKVICRCKPSTFGTNVHNAFSDILKLL